MKCFCKMVALALILIVSLCNNIKAQPYQWFEMNGGANDDVREIIYDDFGNMYAGGSFTQIGGIAANTIARFDGTNWHTVGTGVGANGQIMTIAVNGTDVYIGGEFTEIDGVEANNIAKWDGTQWSAIGTGANSWVYTMKFDNAGNLYAGGNFTTINGVSANYIARWNGTNWSSLNYGTNGTVYDIACEGTDVYIAGSFMRLYNGPDPDEDYVYYRYIGKWNGSEWSKISPGNGANGGCFAIESDGLGNIYIGGFFGEVDGETIQYFAMWDGYEWSSPGNVLFNGSPYDIKAHFKDIYVGGDFTNIGGLTANCIAKWDGNAWESISNAGENGTNSVVECMDFDYATNSVIIGGIFNSVNVLGANGAHIARFTDGSFTSAVAVPSAKSATNLGLTNFSANWRSVRGASTYYLDVARDNMFTDIVGGWNNVNVGNVTTYSVNTGLSAATTYYYRVRVQTGAGLSPNSNIIEIKTNNFTLANIEEGFLDYSSDGPAIQITNTITTAAVNPINVEGATIKISDVYVSDEDVLSFINQNGITGSWDVTTGTMTLSGAASLENYQTALRSVTYSSNGTVTLSRTISFTIFGGGYSSNTITRTIRVDYSEPPVLSSIEIEALNYQLGSSPVSITNSLTASDEDNVNFEAAMVQITGNYQNGSDLLTFTDQNGIAGMWDADQGAITLMGSSSIANYQTALRSVKYSNSGSNTAARTISFIVSDGVATSNTLNRQINISLEPVNRSPVLASIETEKLNFVEGDSAAILTNTITVYDEDDINIDDASVQITGNYQNGEDILSFTNRNGITGAWNNESGKLTLTGSSSLAEYQTALRSIKYWNSSVTPNTSTRTISFTVSDGELNSNTLTRQINITAVNSVPVLSGIEDTSLVYIENDTAKVISNKITVYDEDDSVIDSAEVTILENYFKDQDTLLFIDQNGIKGTWLADSGKIKLTGSSNIGNYQLALRNIKYYNRSEAPDTTIRKIGFIINDGESDSDTLSRKISLIPVNDAPFLTPIRNGVLCYTEGDTAKVLADTITVGDVDDINIENAEIRISGNYSQNEDELIFSNKPGITGKWVTENGTMMLTGNASIADYQAALRSIIYFNTSKNPDTIGRTVTFVVNDGKTSSDTSTVTISITAINDAPVLSNLETSVLQYVIKAEGLSITDSLTITDIDDINLKSAVISFNEDYIIGEDKLIYTEQKGIAGKWSMETGTMILTGEASIADYESAITNVKYINSFLAPTESIRKIRIVVSDGDTLSNMVSREIIITGQSTAPTLSNVENEPVKLTKGDSEVLITNTIKVNDSDNKYLFEGRVSFGKGFMPNEDELEFVNQPKITGSYDATTGVLSFTGQATLEEYQALLRTVKYRNTKGVKAETSVKKIIFEVRDGQWLSNKAYRYIEVVSPIITPSNLTIEVNESWEAVLNWEDNSNNEDGFVIGKVDVLKGTFAVLDSVDANTTEFIDSEVMEGGFYKYRVLAFNNLGAVSDTTNDNISSILIPLKPPTNLQAVVSPEGKIDLSWTNNSSVDVTFIIERSDEVNNDFKEIHKCKKDSTKHCDKNIKNKIKYYYRVYAVKDTLATDFSNVIEATGIVTDVKYELIGVPTEYKLYANYPNPFNPSTVIKFDIPKEGKYVIKVFNLLGEVVSVLADKEFAAGRYQVTFDASYLSSGIYFYQLQGNEKNLIKKMLLLK